MVKYCMKCGKQNEDQALFCLACGQKFQGESAPSPVLQGAAAGGATAPGTLLTVERGSGAHAHVLSDVYLKDASGKVLLVARKPSLLHGDYTIVDGNGVVVGFLKPSTHLTHSGMRLEDPNHNLQVEIQHSNIQSSVQVGPFVQRSPPKCWVEDSKGNTVGSIVFTGWLLSFSGVRQDGSRVFDASLAGGAALGVELAAMMYRPYTVTLLDNSFPLPTLVAIFVVINKLGGS
jgi:hypothetical protein